jgi:hypothetical protein
LDCVLPSFAAELTKIAASESKRRRSGYAAAVGAAAPFAAVQAATDYPRGWVDKAVENRVLGKQNVAKLGPKVAPWSVGLGRAAGRLGPGLLTTPIFLSGIKDLSNAQSDADRKKGYAKILGSGVAFSGGKGAIEGGVQRLGGLSSKQALQKVKNLASSRMITGSLAGALTARSVANSVRDDRKGKKNKGLLIPAVTGAAVGAGKGGFDKAYGIVNPKFRRQLPKAERLVGTKRAIPAAMAGRAAAGALSAVVLSRLARAYMKKGKEKQAAVEAPPGPGHTYEQVRAWAADKSPEEVAQQFAHTHKRGDPEATPTRRAVYYALHDDLARRGATELPPPKKRGEATGVARTPNVAHAAALSTILVAPELVWHGMTHTMAPGEKSLVMSEALDRMIAERGIERMNSGHPFWGTSMRPGAYMRLEEEATDKATRELLEVARGANNSEARKLLAAYGTGKRKFILAPEKAFPDVLAHELGHATAGSLRQKTLQHPMASVVARYARLPAIALPIIAMAGIGDGSFATKKDFESRAKFVQGVGIATALLSGPNLAEEAVASGKALKYLSRAGASPRQATLKALKRLVPAFGTYAAPVVFPFAVAHSLRRRAEKAGRDG